MANIYTFTPDESQKDDFDSSNPNYQIASVAYVCFLIKKVLDTLEDHINTPSAHENAANSAIRTEISINMDEAANLCKLPEAVSADSIDVESINTDSKHRFISDAQLSILKDKPSYHDVQSLILDAKNEFKTNLSDTYIKLLNTPNAFQKLKSTITLIENNENINTILSTLAGKVDATDLEEHINSVYHLNNNDRKAINLLLRFIEQGCADWNATEEDPNYIRNKPDSLPANGGNADTVGGFEANKLINHQLEKCIFGIEGNDYKDNVVDTMFSKDEKIDEIINALSSNQMGLYSFKNGIYNFDNFKLDTYYINDKNITICGYNHNTVFNAKTVLINGKIYIKDLTFTNASIKIKSYCTFDNVCFKNCKIVFEACNEATIRNCTFENCDVRYDGSLMNSMIFGCRFANCGRPIYVSSNNFISNNIYY